MPCHSEESRSYRDDEESKTYAFSKDGDALDSSLRFAAFGMTSHHSRLTARKVISH